MRKPWIPPGIISERSARTVLEPLHGRLHQTVQRAWTSYEDAAAQRSGIHARWRTTTMHQCMTEHARELFDGIAGVSVVDGERFLLNVGDKLLVQFKKLDADLLTSNYPTPTARKFDHQEPVASLPSPKLPRVTLGYQPKRDWTTVLAITLVHRVGKSEPHWFYDLEASSEEMLPRIGAGGLPENVVIRPRPQQALFDKVTSRGKPKP
jgi:hypothetical protein